MTGVTYEAGALTIYTLAVMTEGIQGCKCVCCMMKPYIKDGKYAISSLMHTSVCKSPPVDITNMK